jgi:hypothetical protein
MARGKRPQGVRARSQLGRGLGVRECIPLDRVRPAACREAAGRPASDGLTWSRPAPPARSSACSRPRPLPKPPPPHRVPDEGTPSRPAGWRQPLGALIRRFARLIVRDATERVLAPERREQRLRARAQVIGLPPPIRSTDRHRAVVIVARDDERRRRHAGEVRVHERKVLGGEGAQIRTSGSGTVSSTPAPTR